MGTYVLPNRKAFADSITRIFLKYRKLDRDPIDRHVGMRELFPYQKLIRDYMTIETPYRGILLYHGLGSGKTCSSIAVAESLLTTNKVVVMLPASLKANYLGEIRKCGDPIYAYEQFWTAKPITPETRAEAKSFGITDSFLDTHASFYVTTPGKEPNFLNLSRDVQETIKKQIDSIINDRFSFINYNGLSSSNIKQYVPDDEPDRYNDTVIIIDEVHNFISRIIGESEIAKKLYDALYNAKRCKIVALSGTPVINRPNEIAFLMNLLRGPIERTTIPFKTAPVWDEERMTTALRNIPDIDTIEFNALKKYVMVTRNPSNFRSVYNEKGDRIAVQYVREMPYIEMTTDWVESWKGKFEENVGGAEIAMERITTDKLECLPTNFDEFSNLFLDGLAIKNPMLFQRRIQGLVSYFKGADEKLIPRRVDDDKMLEKIEMSSQQFTQYLEVRFEEMKMDSRKGRSSMNDDLSSFRVGSRLACNYAVPPELRKGEAVEVGEAENAAPEKSEILEKLRQSPSRYLTEEALKLYSPKMLKMLMNVRETGTKNQFVYSQYRSLEGLGVFSAILDANGWQQYKIIKQNNQWIEDPDMDADKPAYTFYTGEEKVEIREFTRQIFNESYDDTFPASLKQSVESQPKKKLSLLMASASGAEGITLLNVRHVHIMEPHWTPARHDQVIGRAIRINSHISLPEAERTVRVSFYLSVFSEEQAKSTDNKVVPVRRNDMTLKRYDGGQATETFMTTDEYLYETAYEKEIVNGRIAILLKQAAVDCEIHRKLHGREKPVISCMRFDTTATGEDLAFKPSIKTEDADLTYLRNTVKRKRRLQKVAIKGMVFLIDVDSREVFDGTAFEDDHRLLRLGFMTSSSQIRFLLT
jgi:superfamily II DNA or RNA helicase